jgi:hypothetical protein
MYAADENQELKNVLLNRKIKSGPEVLMKTEEKNLTPGTFGLAKTAGAAQFDSFMVYLALCALKIPERVYLSQALIDWQTD